MPSIMRMGKVNDDRGGGDGRGTRAVRSNGSPVQQRYKRLRPTVPLQEGSCGRGQVTTALVLSTCLIPPDGPIQGQSLDRMPPTK